MNSWRFVTLLSCENEDLFRQSHFHGIGLGALGRVQYFPTENQFEITNETINKVTLCHGSDSTDVFWNRTRLHKFNCFVLFGGSGICVVCGSATSADVFADITQVWHDLVKQQKWPLTHSAFSSDSFICCTRAIYYHQLRLLASHCFLLPRDT